MESKTEIAKAIVAVMKSVKAGVEKNLSVGAGNSSYKGVSDQDVKKAVGRAMAENGLVILPIGIDAKVDVTKWEETSQYGNKTKQSVFTEVKTKYLLLHESGESIEIEGYGHGVDSQDKSAGKATTYALKYALLYSFLVPTGKIDDADLHSSDDAELPPVREVVLSKLMDCENIEQITFLFKAHKLLVEKDQDLLKAFGDRKAEIKKAA